MTQLIEECLKENGVYHGNQPIFQAHEAYLNQLIAILKGTPKEPGNFNRDYPEIIQGAKRLDYLMTVYQESPSEKIAKSFSETCYQLKNQLKAGTIELAKEYRHQMNDDQQTFANLEALHSLYQAKNKDYGDSFSKSVGDFGYIAMLVRISDKLNRIQNLKAKQAGDRLVFDETIEDSYLDALNYLLMSQMALDTKA